MNFKKCSVVQQRWQSYSCVLFRLRCFTGQRSSEEYLHKLRMCRKLRQFELKLDAEEIRKIPQKPNENNRVLETYSWWWQIRRDTPCKVEYQIPASGSCLCPEQVNSKKPGETFCVAFGMRSSSGNKINVLLQHFTTRWSGDFRLENLRAYLKNNQIKTSQWVYLSELSHLDRTPGFKK